MFLLPHRDELTVKQDGIFWHENHLAESQLCTNMHGLLRPLCVRNALEGSRYLSSNHKLPKGCWQSWKAQTLLQLYGTYLREAKQRTKAFLSECFKVDSCTDNSSAPTGSTAMHWYNCMHHPFLVLSVTVWEHIAQGLGSNMTLKRSTALCFHVFVWAVLEFTAQRMCLGLETSLGEKHSGMSVSS